MADPQNPFLPVYFHLEEVPGSTPGAAQVEDLPSASASALASNSVKSDDEGI